MKKIVKEYIKEGYGAGFSVSSFRGGMGTSSRGGFEKGSFGGSNQMYSYSIVPLNHTLEQRPSPDAYTQIETIKLGSKITGYTVRSNASPSDKKITGIVYKISQTNDGALKYYLVQDEATQMPAKIEPLSAKLITHEPVEYYQSTTDNIPSRRREKIRAHMKENKFISYKDWINEK